MEDERVMALVISIMVLRTAKRIRGDTTLSQDEQNVSVHSRSENTQKVRKIKIPNSERHLSRGSLGLSRHE